ncbi:MAG: rhodanese-like domain-containing protein [Patescibacteria group bacterium]
MTNLNSKSLHALLTDKLPSDAVLVDVRQPEEFAENRIAEAINIPVNSLIQNSTQLNKYSVIYLYCFSGSRSYVVSHILQQAGFQNVFNLQDGLIGWVNNKFPLEK